MTVSRFPTHRPICHLILEVSTKCLMQTKFCCGLLVLLVVVSAYLQSSKNNLFVSCSFQVDISLMYMYNYKRKKISKNSFFFVCVSYIEGCISDRLLKRTLLARNRVSGDNKGKIWKKIKMQLRFSSIIYPCCCPRPCYLLEKFECLSFN